VAQDGFVEPVAWHASLPGVVATAAGIIADNAGNVLIVKPNYRDHWTLPGGICEFGEAPHAGCAREVTEETGLELPVGRLLSVDWQLPDGRQASCLLHLRLRHRPGRLPHHAAGSRA